MATERLRPEPDQGNTLAAGALALTVLVWVLNARFDAEWGQGIHLIYTALAAGFVLSLAAQTPRPAAGERPSAWQSMLFIASFALSLRALVNLADVFGAEDAFGSTGTLVWVGLLLTGLMAWFARSWNSGVSNLIAVVTFGVVIVSFVDWVFSPEDVDTFRWVFLVIALGYGLVGMSRRPTEPHHAVGFVNAAGLAVLAIGVTFLGLGVVTLVGAPSGDFALEAGWGWELIILVGAAGLIAYSAAFAQPGPGYLGVVNLLAFLSLAGGPGEDGPSLIGWPLLLIVVTGALFALGMNRGTGGPGAGVPARPSPDPSEPPTAVQQRP